MFASLGPHGLQHSRLPCPSSSPRVCLSSCPLHLWYDPTISSSVSLFSFCLQFSPASGSDVWIRWPKYWSFNFRISPSNEYSGLISFKIDWFDLLAVSGELSRVFSSTTIRKQQFFGALPSLWSSSHNHMWLLERPYPWLYGPLLAKQCLHFLTHCLGLS